MSYLWSDWYYDPWEILNPTGHMVLYNENVEHSSFAITHQKCLQTLQIRIGKHHDVVRKKSKKIQEPLDLLPPTTSFSMWKWPLRVSALQFPTDSANNIYHTLNVSDTALCFFSFRRPHASPLISMSCVQIPVCCFPWSQCLEGYRLQKMYKNRREPTQKSPPRNLFQRGRNNVIGKLYYTH